MSHFFPAPAYADTLLSLVPNPIIPPAGYQAVGGYFGEYFTSESPTADNVVDYLNSIPNVNLRDCLRNFLAIHGDHGVNILRQRTMEWTPCLRVNGVRGLDYVVAGGAALTAPNRLWPNPPLHGAEPIGLRTADALWLFFMEKSGLFQILEQLIRDYADVGRHDLQINGNPQQVHSAAVLEMFSRLDENNNGSQVPDRESLYQRCLGWTIGFSPRQPIAYNRAATFEDHFHGFIRKTIAYYDQTDALATLAAPAAAVTPAATAQDVSIILQKLAPTLNRPFDRGRNYQNCLIGIVSAISTMSVIASIPAEIGLETSLIGLPQQVSSAYVRLVPAEQQTGSTDLTRFLAYHDCATHGRNLLLCIGQQNFNTAAANVQNWINTPQVREAVMAYRQGWKEITGIDLAPFRQLSRS